MNTMYEFDAIGTRWWLEILSEQKFTKKLKATIDHTVSEFDQRYSRFRDDSLVSELARTGRVLDPPQELVDMLSFCKEMYDVSDGAFNIGVGATLHRFGYGKRIHGGVVDTALWDHISLSPQEIRSPIGVMLDLGGCGKGWLIDLIVQDMRRAGIERFIVNGGGDLYCHSDQPIEIALEDPYDSTKRKGQTLITKGALAVSSTIKRTWMDGDIKKHHIIDPAQDDSSDSGVVASYVKADTALIADTMATIMILRPELEATLKERYHLRIILVRG